MRSGLQSSVLLNLKTARDAKVGRHFADVESAGLIDVQVVLTGIRTSDALRRQRPLKLSRPNWRQSCTNSESIELRQDGSLDLVS
jgi:hypothetical protein